MTAPAYAMGLAGAKLGVAVPTNDGPRVAAEAGHTSRAVSAYGLAAQHYSALSRKEEAEECIARGNGLVSGSTRS